MAHLDVGMTALDGAMRRRRHQAALRLGVGQGNFQRDLAERAVSDCSKTVFVPFLCRFGGAVEDNPGGLKASAPYFYGICLDLMRHSPYSEHMNTPHTRSKLTVRVWDRLVNLLAERAEEICLRRDALLGQVIALEIDHLREDLAQPNSQAARRHIEHHLRALLSGSNGRQLSLALSPATVQRLEDACAEKNVPREAFLNRVILLLVAKPDFLERALFNVDPEDGRSLRSAVHQKFMVNLELTNGFAPLPTIADILADPFWGYREMTAVMAEDAGEPMTFYSLQFTSEALCGLNCYVPDARVPGTAAYLATQQEQQAFSQLMAALG